MKFLPVGQEPTVLKRSLSDRKRSRPSLMRSPSGAHSTRISGHSMMASPMACLHCRPSVRTCSRPARRRRRRRQGGARSRRTPICRLAWTRVSSMPRRMASTQTTTTPSAIRQLGCTTRTQGNTQTGSTLGNDSRMGTQSHLRTLAGVRQTGVLQMQLKIPIRVYFRLYLLLSSWMP